MILIDQKEFYDGKLRYSSISGTTFTVPERVSFVAQAECIGEPAGADILSTTAAVLMESMAKRELPRIFSDAHWNESAFDNIATKAFTEIASCVSKYQDSDKENQFALSTTMLFVVGESQFYLFRIGSGNAYLRRSGAHYSELPHRRLPFEVAGTDIYFRAYTVTTRTKEYTTGVLDPGDDMILAMGNIAFPSETEWDRVHLSLEQSPARMIGLWNIRRETDGNAR